MALGCSRPAEPLAAPSPTSQVDARPPVYSLRIDPLTAIPRHGLIHLTAVPAGIYFVLETKGGSETVEFVNESNFVEETPLTSASVAAAFGYPAVTGTFQGLAGAGDFLYFYFAGTSEQHFHAALGRYSLTSKKIELLADEHQIADLSAAGDELSICRGEVACAGKTLWLWLHSLDGSYFLQRDLDQPGPEIPLRRGFDHLDAQSLVPELTHEGYEVNGCANGALLILDPWMREIWQITPAGKATPVVCLVGLPNALSAPVPDANNQIVLFSADAELIGPRLESQRPQTMPSIEFPALMIFGGADPTAVSRSEMRCPPQFSIDSFRFAAMCQSPRGNGWIGYDTASSELFSLNLSTTPPLNLTP